MQAIDSTYTQRQSESISGLSGPFQPHDKRCPCPSLSTSWPANRDMLTHAMATQTRIQCCFLPLLAFTAYAQTNSLEVAGVKVALGMSERQVLITFGEAPELAEKPTTQLHPLSTKKLTNALYEPGRSIIADQGSIIFNNNKVAIACNRWGEFTQSDSPHDAVRSFLNLVSQRLQDGRYLAVIEKKTLRMPKGFIADVFGVGARGITLKMTHWEEPEPGRPTAHRIEIDECIGYETVQ